MASNSTQFREAIKPQDMVAAVITLMGVAIAIFLSDAIIKLIGASIAVLGMVALYVTIKQRISDQVQVRSRRTTLPPPAFKTRVTQDPSTSVKRTHFDDFQETFAPVDDEPADAANTSEGFTTSRPAPAESRPATRTANMPLPTFGDDDVPPLPIADDDADDDDVPAVAPRRSAGLAGVSRDALDVPPAFAESGGGESFRVIAPSTKKPAAPAETARQAAPVDRAETATPAGSQAGKPADVPGVAAKENAGTEGAAADRRADGSARVPAGSSPPGTVVDSREAAVPAGAEDRAEVTPTRRQAPFVVEDLASDGDEDVRSSEPRGEFVRLVGQVLNAIARSIQARSIVFFWVNFEKGHLIPEAKVTTGRHEIRTGARIALGNDVISQIARSGVPEVIADISPAAERELIAYYTGAAGTRSLVGVPVFFRREVVGVLAADSTDENGFDEVSVATLAEYTRLISGLIRSYTEKYDLHLIARTLDAFEAMSRDFSGSAPNPTHTAQSLARQVHELFDSLYVGVVLFDEAERDWTITAFASDVMERSLQGMRLDMRSSLVGLATRNAQEVLVEQITNEPRFIRGEDLQPGGTFLAIPLVATTKCYGALAIEHLSPQAYIPRDIELMRDLASYAAMAIEVFNTNRAIESHVVHDEVTGLYNSEFLLSALEREIFRARDFKEKLSFALISIDLPASLRAENSAELEEIIAGSVGSVIESAVRPYDTIGRYGPQLFGAVLVKRGDQDAYLWAEKLRKEVASSILALGDRKSAVTISVGISDLSDHATRDSMIDGARQALAKAQSGDGNAVILY